MVEPEVVVGDGHLVEGDPLGVLEETVGSPDVVEPLHVQDAVLLRHVLRQPQAVVPPALRQEDVRHVRLNTRPGKKIEGLVL